MLRRPSFILRAENFYQPRPDFAPRHFLSCPVPLFRHYSKENFFTTVVVRRSPNSNGCQDCLWKLLQFVSFGRELPAVLATVGSVQSEASNLNRTDSFGSQTDSQRVDSIVKLISRQQIVGQHWFCQQAQDFFALSSAPLFINPFPPPPPPKTQTQNPIFSKTSLTSRL